MPNKKMLSNTESYASYFFLENEDGTGYFFPREKVLSVLVSEPNLPRLVVRLIDDTTITVEGKSAELFKHHLKIRSIVC